jgi:HAE1 family hydrophobic/amphiphilic exporter-1
MKKIGFKKGMIRFFVVTLVTAALGQPAWTQENPTAKGGKRVLTLDQALAIAWEKNKDIQKAKEYRKQVEGRYVEERAAALPQFVLQGSFNRSRDESMKVLGRAYPLEQEILSVGVGVSQVLYSFGQVGAAIRAAKVGIQTADDQLALYQQAALKDVSAAFYDALLSKELYQMARQNLEQRIRHQEEAKKKYAVGTATEYDVLAAEVAMENARPEVIRGENLVRITRDRLRFLLGLEERDIEVEGTLTTGPAPVPSLEECLAQAWKNRPELSALKHRIGMAEELVKIYRAMDKPRLDLKAGYGWKSLDILTAKGEGTTWSAGLILTFPFFDGLRTRGKVAQAQSEVNTLKIEEAKLMDAILLQTQEALNAVREAEEIVKGLSGTVAQAKKLLAMAEKGYEFGVKTKLDVDDAELNLMLAQTNLAKARRDYLAARTNLLWVMGVIRPPAEVSSVNAPKMP